jgi:alpha/beta hydrolase fold
MEASSVNVDSLPELEGVEHRFIGLGGGVTIHVADAGPADGAPVMLVHCFPQNWWEWHELIGPLAGDGYRVLCPDLRGAGWSSSPRDRYFKADMADDLAAGRWVGSACGARLGRPCCDHHDAPPPAEGVGLFRTEHHRTLGHSRFGVRAPSYGDSGIRSR